MIPHSKPDIGEAEIDAVARVMRSGRLSQGPEVAAFEEECAAFVGKRHGVAVSSGTAALHLALVLIASGKDDIVAMPAYACAALLQPVLYQGAQPALCEIGPDYNLDPETVPEDCYAALVPHLFGRAASSPPARFVIDDIAQAMGIPPAAEAAITITSFYATKMLATGEGGMLFTDDDEYAEAARDLRDYDNRDSFAVRYAYKMSEIEAALGRVQLARLPGFLERRQAIAQQYTQAFRDLPLVLPDAQNHVFFRYVVATPRREELEACLNQQGIEAKRPVYKPLHHDLGGVFPKAERAHQTCLSLPIYPAITDQEVDTVCGAVQRFFA